jgi:hypothetical protein
MPASRPFRNLVAAAALAIGGASAPLAYAQANPGQSNPADAARAGSAANRDRSNAERLDRSTNAPSRSLVNPNATPGGTADRNSPDSRALSHLIGQIVQAGLSDEPRQVSQYFSQADRRRLEPNNDPNATRRNSELDQALTELKRNYRERYKEDLALSDSATLFGPDFLRPSDNPAERARTAGGRVEGSTSPDLKQSSPGDRSADSPTGGTSGITGNVAGTKDSGPSYRDPAPTKAEDRDAAGRTGTSGDRAGKTLGTGDTTTVSKNAQAAETTSANSRSFTLPASHGLPEVQLVVTKEGADSRLDVPDSLTPDRLQEQLAKHLQRATAMKDQWPREAAETQRALGHHILAAITEQEAKPQR